MRRSSFAYGALSRLAAVTLLLLCACGKDAAERRIQELESKVDALAIQVESLAQKMPELERQHRDARQAAGSDREEKRRPESRAVRPVTFTLDGSEIDDPYLGNSAAEILLLEFGDFECAPCVQFYEESFAQLNAAAIEKGKVKFVYRDFPLVRHSNAENAAQAAHCAGEQGLYWEAWHLLLQNRERVKDGAIEQLFRSIETLDQPRFAACLAANRYGKEIAADTADARRLGIKGAPGFILAGRQPNGEYSGVLIRGAQPAAIFERELAKLLQ